MPLSNIVFEKSFALIPLFITGLALAYDVGFFWAIDPSFFMYFSLSEHIVFAAQAIPLAVTAAAIALVFISWLNNWEKTVSPAGVNQDHLEPKKRKLLAIIFVGVLLFNVFLGAYEMAVFLVLILAAGKSLSSFSKEIAWRIWVVGTFVIAIGFVFIAGASAARVALEFDTPAHVLKYKNTREFTGRVLRAGDSGILFFDVDLKRVRFLARAEFLSFERIVSSRYPSLKCLLLERFGSPCREW